MSYKKILEKFNDSFISFRRISVAEQNDIPSPVHPIIRFSSGMAFNSLSSDSTDRLLMIFPRRFQADLWMAILCALELMKIDYEEQSEEIAQFTAGQKLLFNNICIVEFQGFHDKNNIWLNTLDGRITLKLDRLILLQPIDTEKKLSSLKKVNEVYFSAPICPFDYILDIASFGNRFFFKSYVILVNKIGKTSTYIREHKINECRIIDLMLWGKLSEDGKINIINPLGIDATPTCIISSDLFSTANHLGNESENIKAVIISNPDYCMNDPQSFDYLLDNKIKTIVTADLYEIEKLKILQDRGFKIWQWNERNIQDTVQEFGQHSETVFCFFDKSLDLYCHKKTNVIECAQPILEQIVNNLFDLDKYLPGDHQELKNLYVKLVQIINEISRLVRIPSQNWMDNLNSSVEGLIQSFDRYKMWLSDEAIKTNEEIFTSLININKNSFKDVSPKIESLKSIIFTKHPAETIAILLPRDTDKEFTYKYWSSNLNRKRLRNVHFLTPFEASNYSLEKDFSSVVVCGWYGKYRMYSILHSLITKDITLILYPFELDWFNSASKTWERETHFNIKATDFSDILKIPKADFKYFDYVYEEKVPSLKKEPRIDILDFELKLKDYKYSGYKSEQGAPGITEKVKLLEFSNNQFAFFTESHQVLVLTKLIAGKLEKKEIPRKTINELKVGDIVLFRDSDKDLIREIADKGLEEKGLSHFLELSASWKKTLHELYSNLDFDFNRLYELLLRAGSRRHPTTIRSWLFSDHIIGPADYNDIKFIAEASKNEKLLTNFEKIKEAITAVRGAHLQASAYLTRKLLAKLPQIINEESDYRDSFQNGPIILDLEDFGQIKILQIEEIGDEWIEVDKSFVNHLISHEVDQWQE